MCPLNRLEVFASLALPRPTQKSDREPSHEPRDAGHALLGAQLTNDAAKIGNGVVQEVTLI